MNDVVYSSHESMFRSNPVLFTLFVILSPAVIGLIALGIWYFKTKMTYLEVSRSGVLFSQGLLRKNVTEFPISAIRTVSVDQTLLERWTGAGTIRITTAGDTPEVVAVGMPDVAALKRVLKGGT